jgi:hypothetical protein
MKKFLGMEVELHAFLSSALDRIELQAPVALPRARQPYSWQEYVEPCLHPAMYRCLIVCYLIKQYNSFMRMRYSQLNPDVVNGALTSYYIKYSILWQDLSGRKPFGRKPFWINTFTYFLQMR